MKKLLLASLCILLLSITQVFAQNRTVTGTVTAQEDGLPIPGVTVKVKGTTVGTQTGANGKFTLSVPENAVLIFSKKMPFLIWVCVFSTIISQRYMFWNVLCNT